MKLKDCARTYWMLFLLGLAAGALCRLTDLLPYEESLWSLPSVATLLGVWIASVTVITLYSASARGAFVNTSVYLLAMTLAFYGLKYILGLWLPRFANEGFQTSLFLLYAALSLLCGAGCWVLYSWNRERWYSAILWALPPAGLLAEAAGCLIVLCRRRMLLGQTLFDALVGAAFAVVFFRRARSKALYLATLILVAAAVFWTVYRPFLSAF